MTDSTGQMCWRYPYPGAATRDLYLRYSPLDRWQSAADFPHLVRPNVPEFSTAAWPTYQALLAKGWVLVKDV